MEKKSSGFGERAKEKMEAVPERKKKTKGPEKNKQSGKRLRDKQRKGEKEGRKKMRTLLEDFMSEIDGQQEQGEALKVPSAGANRAKERRTRC